jgi:hypothetical protein
MKKILMFLITATCLLFSNCKDPKPGSTNPALTTVRLLPYMVFCEEFFEGTLRPLKVRINVDRYSSNGTFQSNYKNYRFNVQNDDFDPKNTEFQVEVPSSGSYAVSVEVEGADCYKCCNTGSCTSFFPARGYPFWRGLSTVFNSFPPPSVINVTPQFVSCD